MAVCTGNTEQPPGCGGRGQNLQNTAKGRVGWVLSSVLFGGPGLFIREEVGQEGRPSPRCLTIRAHPLSILAC